MSTKESKDAFFDVFQPDFLLRHTSEVPFALSGDASNAAIYWVHYRVPPGLCIVQTVAHALYAGENVMKNSAEPYLEDYRLSLEKIQASSTTTAQENLQSKVQPEAESEWRRVDAANRRFSESENHCRTLVESAVEKCCFDHDQSLEITLRPRKIQRVESGEEAGAGTMSKTLRSRLARSDKKPNCWSHDSVAGRKWDEKNKETQQGRPYGGGCGR